MKCPHCPDSILVMSDRQGVEIDYCPSCRGIWLDRGELDKLLERSVAAVPLAAPAGANYSPPPAARRHSDFEDSDYGQGHRKSHYRKKSWLHEIFD